MPNCSLVHHDDPGLYANDECCGVMHKLELVGLLKQDLSITNDLIEPNKFYQHESNTTVEQRSFPLPPSWQTKDTAESRRGCAQAPPRLEKRTLVRRRRPKGDARCQISVAAVGAKFGGRENLGEG